MADNVAAQLEFDKKNVSSYNPQTSQQKSPERQKSYLSRYKSSRIIQSSNIYEYESHNYTPMAQQSSVKSIASKFGKKFSAPAKFYDEPYRPVPPNTPHPTIENEPLRRTNEIDEMRTTLNEIHNAQFDHSKGLDNHMTHAEFRHRITYKNDDEAALEMKRLNNILADYKAEVFLLEADKRRLNDELKRIKQPLMALDQYENSVKVARQNEAIAWSEKDAHVRSQLATVTADYEILRHRFDQTKRDCEEQYRKIEELQRQNVDLQTQIGILRMQGDDKNERNRELNAENDSLNEALKKLRTDFELERQLRDSCENQVSRLQSQTIEFAESVTQLRNEFLEATAALPASDIVQADLKAEIEGIRHDYEMSRDKLRDQFEQRVSDFYHLWLNENKNSDQLRAEVADLRSQNERLNHLQNEVPEYRSRIETLQHDLDVAQQQYKLLQEQYDQDNNRWSELKNILEGEHQQFGNKSVLRGEKTESSFLETLWRSSYLSGYSGEQNNFRHAKWLFKRRKRKLSREEDLGAMAEEKQSSHGERDIVFEEIDLAGRFVLLKNEKTSNINFSGWILTQKVNGRESIRFYFPSGLILPPGNSIKLWANVYGAVDRPPKEIIIRSQRSWGIGDVESVLVDENDKERAYFQRTHTATAI